MVIDWQSVAAERAKSGHALLGPSTLPRLVRCPGSLSFAIRNGAQNTSSPYAIEGSQAHMLAEEILLDPVHISAALKVGEHRVLEKGGQTYPFEITEEMADAVDAYVEWCLALPGEHFVETKVSIDKLTPLPGQFGTADFGAIDGDHLVVTDLKYGQGEVVYAERNEQLAAYALGFYWEWEWAYRIRRVTLRIAQPRINHWDVWETTAEELLAFGEEIRTAIATALSDDAPLKPGEKQCRFCPMTGRCAIQRQAILDLVRGDFDGFGEEPSQELEELSKALQYRQMIKHWLGVVERIAMNKIARGAELPHHEGGAWKLVEGRSHRQWKNDKSAAEYMLDDLLLEESSVYGPPKLISPAKAEKLLKKQKKLLDDHIMQPRGKPTLAPPSDKREPMSVIAEDFREFDNPEITEEGE